MPQTSPNPFKLEELSSLVHSEDQRKKALNLREDDAVKFMDRLLLSLDGLRQDSQISKTSQSQILPRAEACLLKLAQKSKQLPSSFIVNNIASVREHKGGGGFADVWKGSLVFGSASNGQQILEPVALKVLRVYASGSAMMAQATKEFCHEALIWRQLVHPNILPFIGITHNAFPNQMCMVAPWMENGTILTYLEQYPTSDRKALLTQITSGLEYLHERSPVIIHGDVRAANVLVNERGEACLADFGLSILADSLAAMTSSTSGLKGGNFRWLPPELIRPGTKEFNRLRKSPSADVYSFAGVCYEVYTGKMPYYQIRSDAEVMLSVMDGSRPSRPTVDMTMDDLPNSVWSCMEKCWKQNPSERPSMHDVLLDLTTSEEKVFEMVPTALNFEDRRRHPSGDIQCAEPAVFNGHEMLLLGYENGLWLCPRGHSSNSGIRQILDLRGVTRCTVLEDLGLVLLLAGKPNVLGANGSTSPSVWACKLSNLVTAGSDSNILLVRLNDWNHIVTGFRVGVVNGRTLLVYLRKFTGKEYQLYHERNMVSTVLEADAQEILKGPKGGGWLSKALAKEPKWFKLAGYSVCRFRPIAPAFNDIRFLNDIGGWAIRTRHGYFLCPLSKLKPTVDEACRVNYKELDWSDYSSSDSGDEQVSRAQSKETLKGCPIGIVSCDPNKVLVCYPKYGAFLRTRKSEDDWEEHQVQWRLEAHQAFFQWPHVLLFSKKHIEVRNISTGTFIQTIKNIGKELRCVSRQDDEASSDDAGTRRMICVAKDAPEPEGSAGRLPGGVKIFEIGRLVSAGQVYWPYWQPIGRKDEEWFNFRGTCMLGCLDSSNHL